MASLVRSALLLGALGAVARAQIPSLGWCPDYVPMAEFNMDRYLGTWYEAERYFSVLEAGSRCVSTNYTKAVDGRVLVSNQITNRLTGIKRVVEGEIRNVVKGSESKLNIKYSTLPVPFETTYSVLDTDYDSYAVVWSCSSIGPLRTQSAWVMTRERLAPGTVLQMAYGILDKYKISRTFFVKTDQADCAIAEAAAEAEQRRQQQLQQQQHHHQDVRSAVVDPIVKPASPVPVIPVVPVVPVVPIKPDIAVVPVVADAIPHVGVPIVPVVPGVDPMPSAIKSVQPQVPLPMAVAAANAPVIPEVPVAPVVQAAPVEAPAAVQVPVVHVESPAAAVQAAPVQAAPVQAAPVQAAPVQAAPVHAAPVQGAPVHAAPVPEVPVVHHPAAPSSEVNKVQ